MEIDDNKDFDLQDIAERFKTEGRVKQVFPFGSGHINDTYKVLTEEGNYLLQRVNQQVFMDVRGLTSNMIRVTNYLTEQIPEKKDGMQVLNTIRTNDGSYFYIDEEAGFWRMFDFIEGAKSFDRAENPEIVREGGKAFGWFIKSLKDFYTASLGEPIPDFHNAEARYENFRKAFENDRKGRVEEAREEIAFLGKRKEEMMRIHSLGQAGKIPLRVTHNDTKINNILFDENSKAISVIDLDTVMPGYVMHDFGDAVRTFTNTADEDEKDLSRISMNISYFKALAAGFLAETKYILTNDEIDTLAFSARYITWEQSVRFLGDYLKGDIYYKIKYPTHNLDRAKAQIQLLKSMEKQSAEMEQIIRELI